MLRRQDRPLDALSAIKNELQSLESTPQIQATMRALKRDKRNHYGSICLLAARGLLLTEKGFRLRNLVNFDLQTPVRPPHPSVSRITRQTLSNRPGLVAGFWREKHIWIPKMNSANVANNSKTVYVGLDEWSPFQKAAHAAIMVGTCGIAAIPALFMSSAYERWGTLGGAPVASTDKLFKKWGHVPRGKPLPLRCLPRELGTSSNLKSEWGALGEMTKDLQSTN